MLLQPKSAYAGTIAEHLICTIASIVNTGSTLSGPCTTHLLLIESSSISGLVMYCRQGSLTVGATDFQGADATIACKDPLYFPAKLNVTLALARDKGSGWINARFAIFVCSDQRVRLCVLSPKVSSM